VPQGRNPARGALVLDAMGLNHFAQIDRLDVLRDLLISDRCLTTYVVMDELRRGVAEHPRLEAALELSWITTCRLDELDELTCFAKWVDRIGAGDRDLGEASVFAVAEIVEGIAITDDQSATRVARKYGLTVHGTIWLLARACKNGKLTVGAAGNMVDMLRRSGMRLPFTGAEFETRTREWGLLP
jgi:predicted nucleic acid-binding protein